MYLLLFVPGADMMLTAEEVSEELVKAAKIFHFGTLSMTNELVEKATQKAVSLAKESGALISFDPNLRPPLWKNLQQAKEKMAYGFLHCDILKISDDEILFFTGETDIDKGIQKIRENYPIKLICATLGKKGSIAFYKDCIVECAPFLNEHTIETTGAGDTFMAACCIGWKNAELSIWIGQLYMKCFGWQMPRLHSSQQSAEH